MVNKLIVVGCGGIGSNFVTNVVYAIASEQLHIKEIIIYDDDKIELKNKLYTTFECSSEQLGKAKVKVIKEDLSFILEMNGKQCTITAEERKFSENDIKVFGNMRENVVLASTVDGTKFRSQLLEFHGASRFRDNAQWIDMRSHGARYLIFSNPRTKADEELLEPYFVDLKVENASCQRADDLAKKQVQVGNKIVAMIGLQYLLNIDRNLINSLIKDADDSGQAK